MDDLGKNITYDIEIARSLFQTHMGGVANF